MTSHEGPARLRFSLGQIVATPGALDALDRHALNAADLLLRHQHGDWGDLTSDDAAQNEYAADNAERVLSSYRVGSERLWIITEGDRSVTTLLLPSEY